MIGQLYVKALLFILMLIGTWGCRPQEDTVQGEVIDSKPSPDRAVVALISKDNYGTTVSFVYRVYLQTPNSLVVAEILRADKVAGLHVDWNQNKTLSIRMSCGRIFTFKNFFDVIGKDGQLVTRVPVKLDTRGICEAPMNGAG